MTFPLSLIVNDDVPLSCVKAKGEGQVLVPFCTINVTVLKTHWKHKVAAGREFWKHKMALVPSYG
jgi:hypothetical protein